MQMDTSGVTDDCSGADLVRKALSSATVPAEREAASSAAELAAREMLRRLQGYCDSERAAQGFDAFALARQHVIRELRAAAHDAAIPPPAQIAHLDSFERRVFEAELETARCATAEIVRVSLRPPAG